jgi:hypothetical protein
MDLTEIMKKFYDPKTGFRASIQGIDPKKLKMFLQNQETYQLNKPSIQPKTFYPIRSNFPYERIQADLLDMAGNYSGYPKQLNKGYRYILTVIDVFTRKTFARPLKSKEEKEILDKFIEILKEMDSIPSILETDNESAIKGNLFNTFCKKNKIVQFFVSPSDYKGKGVIERFNKTIRNMILLYTTYTGKKKWIEVLPDLIFNYNNHPHSTTGFKPFEAHNHVDEIRKVYNNLVEVADQKVGDLKVGLKVRLKIKKNVFEKKTSNNWTKSIHIIDRIEGNNYFVSDRVHPYKKDELQVIEKVEEPVQEDEEAKEIQKETRQKQELKKVGVNQKDILPEGQKRVRKVPQRFQE